MIQLGIFCKCYILIVYVQSICLTDMCWLTLYIAYFSVSLFTKLANADFNAGLGVMTLSDRTDLTCCHWDKAMCFFYADSRNIGQQNSSDNCCKLTVSGEQLLQGKAGEELQTTIIVHCELKADNKMSQNVTITVWRISLSGKYILIFLVILGTLILLSLLISIILCIIYVTKEQGYRQKFHPARTQVMDNDNQDANSGTVEVQEEKTETVEDELLYATVNHSGAGENSAPVVKFESGTDYATVVIH
ncbi:uncharacterized protein LOC107706450 [Sinocyclocheilus rhinocerous]|uniref:uncharacterized protein LOC107706450 n=1 Tax=Sinocyclocheilus rhinocerous TaxID=307959 RepID=UPI0007BA963A|nr:PREDICTED: uncharacterized protein LOC107706450 [Sinocyclocheilus rhinocerous]